MDLTSHKIKRSKLKVGDHIYTWRKLDTYSHHGILIGEHKLIHFVNSKKDGNFHFSAASSSGSSTKKKKTPCPVSYCGSEKVAGSGVRMSCIDCFIKTCSLYRFKYEVNSDYFFQKLVGTCTTARSDPPEAVMHRATYLYENGYFEYHLMKNNCEDFALYCKTGLWSKDKGKQGRSSQANLFFLTREEDLGKRKDVVKVPVEELFSFRRAIFLK
ncbi:hypothetical protein L1987_56145 [Smallanthus sonchifolius]|uniref:Uncharacterized protein n=3 Tax=Smallanthus sonchifolius TaxID=185202 RepID=A0ACB9EBC2_9ASTR|nr:hypothetical protein L1987_56141 [Smallanthus sonchifolius]KAI3756323.1 hypothetical protein L1987_56143 [Smallanthus sonchifolius]KAI3756325.1 hypothetical protein L1987_56145 [Smallanthus sonchifolius]